jgi:hypothetical protein
LNPRRTKPPETVFETAAFDRSATPPRGPYGGLAQSSRDEISVAAGAGLCPAGGEARARKTQPRRRGHTGETWFPRESERRRSRVREAEKEGFEPSRQGFSPPNALAGRRLQPLGHFSWSAQDSGAFSEIRIPRVRDGYRDSPEGLSLKRECPGNRHAEKITLQGHAPQATRMHGEEAGSPRIPLEFSPPGIYEARLPRRASSFLGVS